MVVILQPLYTFGYSGQQPEELLALAERLNAIVTNIRFSPRSRIPQWNGLVKGEYTLVHLNSAGYVASTVPWPRCCLIWLKLAFPVDSHSIRVYHQVSTGANADAPQNPAP